MTDLYFEDFAVGAALPEAILTVEAEDAAFFAGSFGPGAAWPGPTGPDEAGRPAPLPGWHVAALGMRLLFDAFLCRTAGLGGPGVEEVRWPHPVRVGDTLRFTATVAGARPSASRPGMGIVTLAISIFNQDSARVMTQENAVMVARRPDGPARDGVVQRDRVEARA